MQHKNAEMYSRNLDGNGCESILTCVLSSCYVLISNLPPEDFSQDTLNKTPTTEGTAIPPLKKLKTPGPQFLFHALF